MAFASLSGDFNPMHVDERAARRLLFGKPVVHGMHAVLWSLNEWCESHQQPVALRALRADFQRPILVGTRIGFELRADGKDATEILLRSVAKTVLRLRFAWVPSEGLEETPSLIQDALPVSSESVLREEASLEGLSGATPLFLAKREAAVLFPRALALLPPHQVATLLAKTRVVGMECPGLRSLYSSASLDFSDPPVGLNAQAHSLRYFVESVDGRFHLATLRVDGPCASGSLRAFVRPAPRDQPDFAAACSLVEAGSFHGRRAWVIRGSLGLGEVAAKLLAAGGAEVTITYHRGAEDAARVASEIRQGGDVAETRQLNVLDASDSVQTLGGEGAPTDMLYFATPFIAPGEDHTFSPELFDGYCNYYVRGFVRLAAALAPHGLRRVFFPSSVYVEDPPPNLAEYAAANAAGEVACLGLEKAYPGLLISKPRLPRVATDQTVSLTGRDADDPVPLIFDAL
uniref:SDR family NAD(P)-dependent oxidoreductase n=1 Tax=Roseovarius sp. TaxID=1486281 RepID=UPI003561861C